MRTVGWILLLAAVAGAQELIGNPGFEDGARGWMLLGASVEGAVVRLGPKEGERWTHIGIHVTPVVGRELAFSFRAKGTAEGHAIAVNAFAVGDTPSDTVGFKGLRTPLQTDDWTTVEATYVVPAGAKRLTLWILNFNPGAVLVTEPRLVVGEANATSNMPLPAGSGRTLGGPGVVRASAGTSVRAARAGDRGVVTFPVPALTAHQVPLAFSVKTDPADALVSFAWRQRDDGRNWLCDVTVAPSTDGAAVQWESLVLVAARADAPLPAAAEPAAPADATAWLRSTACVQSADPAIAAKSKELAQGADGVEAYVRNVLRFTSTNQGTGARFDALDARKALDCGGSCTSRANLCAALLRAHGIPARTQAHLPTWSGPLYEHWLVEYWHPGAGWTWVESTLGKMRPQPWTLVVLNVANPDDEDLGFDPRIRRSGVMIGVPLWSVHNIAPPLLRKYRKGSVNVANPVARLEGTDAEIAAAFDAARAAFEGLAVRLRKGEVDAATAERIAKALETKRATDLRAAILGG